MAKANSESEASLKKQNEELRSLLANRLNYIKLIEKDYRKSKSALMGINELLLSINLPNCTSSVQKKVKNILEIIDYFNTNVK